MKKQPTYEMTAFNDIGKEPARSVYTFNGYSLWRPSFLGTTVKKIVA
jgi:hypothetical protein